MDSLVSFEFSPGRVRLDGAPIVVDDGDFTGIHIAASCLAKDFELVTGSRPRNIRYEAGVTDLNATGDDVVIIAGSLASPLLQRLIQSSRLTVGEIEERWESFLITVVHDPLPGIDAAVVIAGSDKRGAIYGIYTLSEWIGVSPWYWWADVCPIQRKTIFISPGIESDGPPSVKYRGIFINDEAPALTSWLHEKIGPVFDAKFYERVFELLLRLKANFLWPAMWAGASFFTDDPRNQIVAEDWGIVISTSHHEPMQRAMGEWFQSHPHKESWSWTKNKAPVQQYMREGVERAKPFESYLTLGMRGGSDEAMEVDNPRAVLEEILAFQQGVIDDVYDEKPKQLLALYKEVQEYFDDGLVVPDDVTLLFADDNFGTLRRLPVGKEMDRRGGAGIYYHLEYVGHPRSYKWINSNHCGRIWQQLQLAHSRRADQIWVFNVGDIKPQEMPLSMALRLAWKIDSISADDFSSFFLDFCKTNVFPVAEEAADLLGEYDRLLAMRKHEHIEADTFSLLNYDEAEDILLGWEDKLSTAEELYATLDSEHRPAFFQLVLHPIKASTIYMQLRFHQARNRLYGSQRRNETNAVAQHVLALFDADYDLAEEYHALLDGKWNHLLRQPHYGYSATTWHAPSRDLVDGLCFVQLRQPSNPIMGNMGVAVEGHPGVRPGLVNEESDRTHPSQRDLVVGVTLPPFDTYGPQTRWFELFRRGPACLNWSLVTRCPWIALSPSSGRLDSTCNDVRVEVTIDQTAVPLYFNETVEVAVFSDRGDYEVMHLPVSARHIPGPFTGFVESDRCVAITTINAETGNALSLSFLGRTGAVAVPFDSTDTLLEYSVYTFTERSTAEMLLYFSMALDTDPTNPLAFHVWFDDDSYGETRLIEAPATAGDLPEGWSTAVQDCVWRRSVMLGHVAPGSHTIKIRMMGAGMALEKIVLDLGGVRESYLGPPARYVSIH
ncbi:hypothetical protein ASPZODRAFT_132347 [Penicilliopsis zonata CBS 506.65]|uniref:Gylcosyl hydrolase 115 C-terminal domain-containing protein n=1 Tax=Penicilliopsis zonata CBS 506.65 TaxID=1073090 RepID=A0A1L9SJT0_9EURO|nr:hypothetical protein ASPZODRAFT_132347 [Penicilliopsis zonata CBS 506.65]OJJ47353.1 hypothetical protein ASPZODRAFT_132347 [Penicilliopsis zonata CBS 506.65]